MAANVPDARLRMRNAVPGPRGGGLYLSELQRTRLLDAAFAVVAEKGYRGMAVRAVSERAGVSSKTFYDLFEDREDCFLQAFDHGVEQLAGVARPAYEAQQEWAAGMRAGLTALLAFLDGEPALRGLLFVEALGVGPRVLARRAEVLDAMASLVERGRAGMETAGELPPLTGAGVVGAALSMIHARLIEPDAEPLIELLNELMATIVLPYRGRAVAARELSRPAPELPVDAARDQAPVPVGSTPLSDFRLTVRRHAALSAVAELCAEGSDPCNREVSERVEISDQGHVSRLMMGLQAQGLLENTRMGVPGTRKAWRLTPRGQAVLQANPPLERKGHPVGAGAAADGIDANSASVNGRATVRVDTPGPRSRGGHEPALGRQYPKLLEATFALVAEEGYRELTVAKLTARAGVSRRTFYESFSDREDCFLQAFDHALDVLAERVLPAYEAEREWVVRVRAGLATLLACLDGEPALRRLVFVEALAAGPQVLARRTQVLDELTAVIDGGRKGAMAPEGVPALAAEAIVGAVFGVIYGQVSQRRPEPLTGLLGSLMAMIVLPYRGSEAAARELQPPAPEGGEGQADRGGTERGVLGHASEGARRPIVRDRPVPPTAGLRPLGSALPADFRLTARTQMALVAVAESNGRGASPSNLQVAERIGVSGKSTVSKLMARLQDQGLVENTRGGDTKGLEKAWRLTPHGQAVLDAHQPGVGGQSSNTSDPADISGGKLVAKRSHSRSAPARPASAGFRLTIRTHLVLTAIAEHAGANSRDIADAAGVRDQGQISKLLARLNDRGLIRNTAHTSAGFPKAWQLTPQGEALVHANRTPSKKAA